MFNNFIFFIPINKFKEEVIQTSPLIELISQNAYGFTIKVDKSLITFEKDCYSIKAAFKINNKTFKYSILSLGNNSNFSNSLELLEYLLEQFNTH